MCSNEKKQKENTSMARKLKRLFSMLLVVSMIMSQVSVAAFAEEMNLMTGSNAEILSSDTRGGVFGFY